jgi:putative FmdB family regulatory protein
MPIYEYKCKSCGAISEFLTTLRNNETISCRSCGSLKLEKIMSAASFLGRTMDRVAGHTCCGREERCDTPPCSTGGVCKRD